MGLEPRNWGNLGVFRGMFVGDEVCLIPRNSPFDPEIDPGNDPGERLDWCVLRTVSLGYENRYHDNSILSTYFLGDAVGSFHGA